MEDLIPITEDIILKSVGKTISYYEVWDLGEFPFIGSAKILAFQPDRQGVARIKCEVIWGADLCEAELNEEGYFSYGDKQRTIFLGPPPFEIYEIAWKIDGEHDSRMIIVPPGEADLFIEDTARVFTEDEYTAKRVQ